MTRRSPRRIAPKPDAFDLIDVTADCEALGMTPEQVRANMRQAHDLGFLAVLSVTDDAVQLRGTFPGEPEPCACGRCKP